MVGGIARAGVMALACLASPVSGASALLRTPRHTRASVVCSDRPEYQNPVVGALSGLLPKAELPSASLDFGVPRSPEPNKGAAAARLQEALEATEWFVTGNVRPELFSDRAFRFTDPDVTLDSLEEYADGVRKLFDQATSRAEVITCKALDESRTVVVRWRLSGAVNLGPLKVPIKAYVVETYLGLDDRGLVETQEDVFSLPGWDIVLSAFLPFLRGLPFLAPEAPPVDELRRLEV